MSSTEKIKIVFILGTLDIGGAERQFLEMIQRLNPQRFTFRVLSFCTHGKLREEIELLHIPLTSLDFQGSKGLFSPLSYLRLYKLLRGMFRYLTHEKPHIVQSYLDWANIWGTIAARLSGVPVIITGRRVTMDSEYMAFSHEMRWYSRWLLNLTNRWATAIVANSEIVRRDCLRREKYITPEKIRVIYNSVDLKRYSEKRACEAKKHDLGIPDNMHVVGMVANLHPRKGYSDFLYAASRVLQTYPDTLFLLVGRDDGMKRKLDALAKNLQISSSVLFLGERDDVPELLALFDVQVASSYAEGLSNAILEGMATGNPVVATDVGGNPELIVDGETGFLVPPGTPDRLAEKIIHLLKDPTLRGMIGKTARKRVGNLFTIERMMESIETLYATCVQESHVRL